MLSHSKAHVNFQRKKNEKLALTAYSRLPHPSVSSETSLLFSFVFPTKLGHYRFLQLSLVAFYGILSAFYMGWSIALVCSGVKVDFLSSSRSVVWSL